MKKLFCFLMALLGAAVCLSAGAKSPAEMNVVILGDSNSWIGGDDCSKPKGWNTWFNRLFAPASCRSYARSGATWSHTPATKINPGENIGVIGNDNVITNQIVRLQMAVESGEQTTPDLIIIAAGTNDLMFPRRRPSALAQRENDPATVVGSLTIDCRKLRDRFPQARIVVLTPLQCVKFTNDRLHSLSDKMESAARKCGADVIRMDRNGSVVRDEELKVKKNTYDGIHTSEKGAEANGRYVAEQIKKIINGGTE